MAYRALYLKYRPQAFNEVAGQAPIVRTLKNALKNEKIAHAYLFSGPRGTGKTTMARLLAKALNCEAGVGRQCNHCSNCLSIIEGTHPDVLEIDAASNNGVDQARELVEQVKYSPIKGRYKVYIIDEVHMMSTGAFNALLKTLEEPPDNVIFILCTTEPHKVLPTILSRCQRFDFGKVSPLDMKNKLLEVLEKENATYEEEALNLVIELSDGGMRDALSILDQALAYGDNALKTQDLLDIYGLASSTEKIDFISDIASSNVSSILERVEKYVGKGVDLRRFTREIVSIFKDVLIIHKTNDSHLLETLFESEAQRLNALFPNEKLNLSLESFVALLSSFKEVNDVRSAFEIGVLQLIDKLNLKETATMEREHLSPKEEKKSLSSPLEEKKEKKGEPPSFLFEDEPLPENKETKETIVETKPPLPNLDTSNVTSPQIAVEGDAYSLDENEIVKILVLASKKRQEREELHHKWEQLLPLKTDPKLGNLATLLSDGKPLALTDSCLIVSYNFKRLSAKANIKQNQKPLSQLVESLLGRHVFVYAVDPIERSNVIKLFYSLQTIHKLPAIDTIVLNLPKEE